MREGGKIHRNSGNEEWNLLEIVVKLIPSQVGEIIRIFPLEASPGLILCEDLNGRIGCPHHDKLVLETEREGNDSVIKMVNQVEEVKHVIVAPPLTTIYVIGQ